MIAGQPPRAIPAALHLAALAGDQVRISYAGHSTFMIESPQRREDCHRLQRLRASRASLPDIATMNHAHSTHYTDCPDPGIKHVLRGWGPSPDEPARHDLQVADVRVRNVPTNIRDSGRRHRAPRQFDLHLRDRQFVHRPPRPSASHPDPAAAQRDRPARRCMVPVDGGVTLDLDGMAEVLAALKAPLMIPMHYFSAYSLRPLPRRPRREVLRGRNERDAVNRGVQDHAAGEAEGAGAARPRVLTLRPSVIGVTHASCG